MAQFPALPLFTDAYMADTRHLTTIQHGCYLLMLMTAWRMPDCALPNDDVFLARICGVDRRTWNINKSILLAFWTLDEQQRLTQGRLKDERNYVVQLVNKNSIAGKASALKRLNRHATTVQPNANQNPTPIPTPILTPSKKDVDAANACAKAPFTIVYDFGCELFPNLASKNTSEVTKWIQAGYDIEKDILPIIKRFSGRNIGGWKYFTQMIVDANAERLNPLPQPANKPKGQNYGEQSKSDRAKSAILRGLASAQAVTGGSKGTSN